MRNLVSSEEGALELRSQEGRTEEVKSILRCSRQNSMQKRPVVRGAWWSPWACKGQSGWGLGCETVAGSGRGRA